MLKVGDKYHSKSGRVHTITLIRTISVEYVVDGQLKVDSIDKFCEAIRSGKLTKRPYIKTISQGVDR